MVDSAGRAIADRMQLGAAVFRHVRRAIKQPFSQDRHSRLRVFGIPHFSREPRVLNSRTAITDSLRASYGACRVIRRQFAKTNLKTDDWWLGLPDCFDAAVDAVTAPPSARIVLPFSDSSEAVLVKLDYEWLVPCPRR
jgi:hypothetical protein